MDYFAIKINKEHLRERTLKSKEDRNPSGQEKFPSGNQPASDAGQRGLVEWQKENQYHFLQI